MGGKPSLGKAIPFPRRPGGGPPSPIKNKPATSNKFAFGASNPINLEKIPEDTTEWENTRFHPTGPATGDFNPGSTAPLVTTPKQDLSPFLLQEDPIGFRPNSIPQRSMPSAGKIQRCADRAAKADQLCRWNSKTARPRRCWSVRKAAEHRRFCVTRTQNHPRRSQNRQVRINHVVEIERVGRRRPFLLGRVQSPNNWKKRGGFFSAVWRHDRPTGPAWPCSRPE